MILKANKSIKFGLVGLCYLLSILISPAFANQHNDLAVPDFPDNVEEEIEFKSDECKALYNRSKDRAPGNYLRYITKPYVYRSIGIENDSLFLPEPGDNNYTNGIQYRWINNPCRDKNSFIREAARTFVGKFRIGSPASDVPFNVSSGGVIGMGMFTPQEIDVVERIEDDRPYAGHLYAGYVASASQPNTFGVPNVMHDFELHFGVVGPAAGQEWAQKFVHQDLTGSTFPVGWENQIPNEPSATIIYQFRSRLFRPERRSQEGKFKFYYHGGFAAGTVVNYLNFGGTLIVGNSGPTVPTGSFQPTGVADLKFSDFTTIYGFLGIDYRYYASSLYIDGSGDAEHDIDRINGVYDISAGLTIGPFRNLSKLTDGWRRKALNKILCNCDITLQLFQRSQEFKSTETKYNEDQKFGRLSLSWRYH